MRTALLALSLVAACLVALPAEAASRGTARASAEVRLQRCTRNSNWCLFLNAGGQPAGWVRGSYLVGSGAKLEVTPYKFQGFDPLDPIRTCDDDDHTSMFCW